MVYGHSASTSGFSETFRLKEGESLTPSFFTKLSYTMQGLSHYAAFIPVELEDYW